MGDRTQLLTGWGRTAPTAAHVRPVRSVEDVRRAVASAGERGVVARGLGRSYGDAAQNAGGLVLDLTGLTGELDLDPRTGVLDAPAGVSLDHLMRELLPLGWFVPVTPGTRFVTLGGALAADVHGKNHHRDGSFARHVVDVDLVTANGEIRTVGPDHDADLFWTTAGGMGLTGVVVRVRVRLRRVESSWMLVGTTRQPDLDGVLAALEAADRSTTYSVAWLDCLANGPALGRGVVTTGEHAPADAVDGGGRPTRFRPRSPLPVPSYAPSRLLSRPTVAAFNELWFRRAPRHRSGETQRVESFFHPLDGVRGWNRLYGRQGLVQHQMVVPFGAEATIRKAVETLSAAGAPSFLAVLKRFGPADPGPLSFAREGWTLALDLPARVTGLPELLDALDRLVLDAGGAVYLAKDSRLDPRSLAAMYPRVDDFRAVRAEVDPRGVFISDLARRLSL